MTPETLQDLGFDTTFDELHIKVADPTLDQDGIRAVADEVSTRIQRAGIPVFGSLRARSPAATRPTTCSRASSSCSGSSAPWR